MLTVYGCVGETDGWRAWWRYSIIARDHGRQGAPRASHLQAAIQHGTLEGCTVAAIGAKAATAVPPAGRLRVALNVALGASHDAHRALWDGPGPGGVDGRRRRRRGTPSDPEDNRQVFSGFGPPTYAWNTSAPSSLTSMF